MEIISSELCLPFVPASEWAPKYFIERDMERIKHREENTISCKERHCIFRQYITYRLLETAEKKYYVVNCVSPGA
jgi:hypothetical protein